MLISNMPAVYNPDIQLEEPKPHPAKTAAQVGSTAASTGLSAAVVYDKYQQAKLNRSGLLTKQVADKTTNELTNLFVQDASSIKGAPTKIGGMPGKVVQEGKDFLAGTKTGAYERIKLNPDIQNQYSYDEISSILKDSKFSPGEIDTLLRPETLTDDFFTTLPADKVMQFGAEGTDPRAVFQSDIMQNVKDLSEYEGLKPQSGDILDLNVSDNPFEVPRENIFESVMGDGLEEAPSFVDNATLENPGLNKAIEDSFSKIEEATNITLEELNEPMVNTTEKLTGQIADATGKQPFISPSIWNPEAVKSVKMVDPSTWTKGGQALGTGSKVMTGVNMAKGAYTVGSTLIDAFNEGELDWEDGKDIIQGSIDIATPYLLAAGPGGWAVLGANALWQIFD